MIDPNPPTLLFDSVRPRWTALLCAFGVIVVSLWNYAPAIGQFLLFDTDDALRLVQVRDLLAGQGWFDSVQHRINPPTGGMMHWSRLIDLPIAGLLYLLEPVFGTATSERIVLGLYPMALIAILFWVMFKLFAEYASRAVSNVGLVLLATSSTMLFQFKPLRIDHHSWQIILAVVVLIFALRRPDARNGAIAGLTMAVYASISIEGAAYMAIFAALFAIAWLVRPSDGDRFIAYTVALAVASPLILIVTRGPDALFQSYCDGISRPYLAFMGIAAAIALVGRRVIGDATPWRRAAILALAAIAGFAAFAVGDPHCLNGPFEALDPRVKALWYDNVKEGQPIWRQATLRLVHVVVPGLVGLVAGGLAVRATHGAERERWLATLFVSAAAFAVSIAVLRTVSVAHIFALPATAWLAVRLFHRAFVVTSIPVRLAAIVAVLLLTPAVGSLITSKAVGLAKREDPSSETRVEKRAIVRSIQCFSHGPLAQLRDQPRSLLFAPLDISPYLLAYSQHSVVATGHHRNQVAMRKVIDGFTLPPERAEAVVRSTGARFVAICPDVPEVGNFRLDNPDGLAARLAAGDVPAWLDAVPPTRGSRILLYRVRGVRPPRPVGSP